MEHYLSPEEIEELKTALKKAEPYPTDSTVPITFDGESDFAREQATMAKILLDMYYREKGWKKDY